MLPRFKGFSLDLYSVQILVPISRYLDHYSTFGLKVDLGIFRGKRMLNSFYWDFKGVQGETRLCQEMYCITYLLMLILFYRRTRQDTKTPDTFRRTRGP